MGEDVKKVSISKYKCPICSKAMILKKDRLKCKCGFECHKDADRCSCCGVILDEEK